MADISKVVRKELNKELHQFFLEKTWGLTEEWYSSLDKSDPKGVYSSTDPQIIKTVKQQNYEFHVQFCEVFAKNESDFLKTFEVWILNVASDEQHLKTPVHLILREFFRTQEQYLNLLDQFTSLHCSEYEPEELNKWGRRIIHTFEKVMGWFVEENHKFSLKRLAAQQEMIKELSSPVITVGKTTALLPIVGEIDTARAKLILENTLHQCSQKGIILLYIDLSGVVVVDTMVAQQIFQLIEGLSLIGVKSVLSGIRPEVAQTAVELGINFDNVSIKPTLQLVTD